MVNNPSIRHNRSIALRFLKETKLLPYWKEYLNSSWNTRKEGLDWADKVLITDIFGETNFTDFLMYDKGIAFFHGRYSYEIFSAFISEFYPEENVKEKAVICGKDALLIDKEKKTVKVILENGKVWR